MPSSLSRLRSVLQESKERLSSNAKVLCHLSHSFRATCASLGVNVWRIKQARFSSRQIQKQQYAYVASWPSTVDLPLMPLGPRGVALTVPWRIPVELKLGLDTAGIQSDIEPR